MTSDTQALMVHIAQSGYHIFPLLDRFRKGDNKAGTPPGWNHNKPSDFNSSLNIEQVVEWSKLPDFIGYGINPRANNVFILDVDCGKSHEAIHSLNLLKIEYELPKSILTVKTKSGGYHFYYEHPDFDVVSSISMLPGIDIRANNSYVRGPDSIGEWSKGNYTVIQGDYSIPLQPLSDKFILYLKKHHAKKFQDNTDGLITDAPDKKFLHGEIPDVIEEGERHITLLRLIGSWCRAGYPRSNIISLLKIAFERCKPNPPSNIDSYISRVDDTLSKSSFTRVNPEPLQFFLDNAIHIKDHDAVYEIPSRRAYFKGLQNVYAKHNYWVEKDNGKLAKLYAYKEWLEHKDKQEVDSIGYKPTNELMFFDTAQNCQVVNTYCPPNLPKVPFNDILWQKFIDFTKYLFQEKQPFMLDWAAHIIQKPDEKLQVALAIISETRGIGKNLFLKILSECIGKHNAVEFRLYQLLDAHVEYPLSKHLVIVNEADRDISDTYSNKQQDRVIEQVKTLITEDYVSVNPKFIRISSVTNYSNYVFTSNNMHAIPLDKNDRRFEIILCDVHKKPIEYYDHLYEILRSPEQCAVIRQGLLRHKIEKVSRSYTADKVDYMKYQVINAGKSFIESHIEEAIENREGIFKEDIITADLFGWFVVTYIANVTQTTAQGLLRKYARPIYRANRKQPRGLRLPSPAVEYKGNDFRPAVEKTQNLFTCRNFQWYFENCDKIEAEDLTLKYFANFKASQPVKLKNIKGAS